MIIGQPFANGLSIICQILKDDCQICQTVTYQTSETFFQHLVTFGQHVVSIAYYWSMVSKQLLLILASKKWKDHIWKNSVNIFSKKPIKRLSHFCEHVDFGVVQKSVNLADIATCFKIFTSNYLQSSASRATNQPSKVCFKGLSNHRTQLNS